MPVLQLKERCIELIEVVTRGLEPNSVAPVQLARAQRQDGDWLQLFPALLRG